MATVYNGQSMYTTTTTGEVRMPAIATLTPHHVHCVVRAFTTTDKKGLLSGKAFLVLVGEIQAGKTLGPFKRAPCTSGG